MAVESGDRRTVPAPRTDESAAVGATAAARRTVSAPPGSSGGAPPSSPSPRGGSAYTTGSDPTARVAAPYRRIRRAARGTRSAMRRACPAMACPSVADPFSGRARRATRVGSSAPSQSEGGPCGDTCPP
ncbi:MAG: hypothetical protein JO040_03705 [Gemmatimonadetes bacterium]|nr:hypothetical protein [Gemmatimonadota bacterium]